MYLGITVGTFAVMYVVSQAWTAGDEAVADWVLQNLSEAQRADWRTASWAGATVVGLALAAIGAATCLVVREWRAAAVTLVTGVLVGFAVHGLKLVVARDRPDDAVLDTYAFPSGHSTTGMLAWGLLVLVVLPAVARHVRIPPLARRLAIALWLAIAALTGASRVLGGVHWTSDVIAGWSCGGALLVIAVRAAKTDRPPPRLEGSATGPS